MRNSIKAGAVLVVVAVAACGEMGIAPSSVLKPGSSSLVKAPKVTICHAAGLAGTTKYVSITLSANGLNGHFGNNGTTKAGHELDFIASEERPCNAPEPAQLRFCKLSSANDPSLADLTRDFLFKRDDGADFSLKFLGCTETFDVVPGQHTFREPPDPNIPNAFSYFATDIAVLPIANLVSKSGFFVDRPLVGEDAIVVVNLVSGQLTTITFYNRN